MTGTAASSAALTVQSDFSRVRLVRRSLRAAACTLYTAALRPALADVVDVG